MPQMAPIYWMMMFLYFLSMYYLMLNILYFDFIKKKINKKISIKSMIKNFNKFI